MRRITQKGLKLIRRFEGFSSTLYLDSAGLKTIGYGHLILPHEQQLFKYGITATAAESLLEQDVSLAESAVTRLINVPLNNHQFDALVSFTFNCGSAALQRSTLRRKVNREEHHDAPAEFMRWIYAGGKRIAGLVRRRRAEARLYLEGSFSKF